MRCAQCGSSIQHEPVWENGVIFCSLDCAEECALVAGEDFAGDAPASGLDRLFGSTDDDDF